MLLNTAVCNLNTKNHVMSVFTRHKHYREISAQILFVSVFGMQLPNLL